MYMNMLMGKNEYNISKDTVYRFLNPININWIRFTTLLAGRIINDTIKDLTSKDCVNVLIVDDTSFERNRSKKVELLSKIYAMLRKNIAMGFVFLHLDGQMEIHFSQLTAVFFQLRMLKTVLMRQLM